MSVASASDAATDEFPPTPPPGVIGRDFGAGVPDGAFVNPTPLREVSDGWSPNVLRSDLDAETKMPGLGGSWRAGTPLLAGSPGQPIEAAAGLGLGGWWPPIFADIKLKRSDPIRVGGGFEPGGGPLGAPDGWPDPQGPMGTGGDIEFLTIYYCCYALTCRLTINGKTIAKDVDIKAALSTVDEIDQGRHHASTQLSQAAITAALLAHEPRLADDWNDIEDILLTQKDGAADAAEKKLEDAAKQADEDAKKAKADADAAASKASASGKKKDRDDAAKKKKDAEAQKAKAKEAHEKATQFKSAAKPKTIPHSGGGFTIDNPLPTPPGRIP